MKKERFCLVGVFVLSMLIRCGALAQNSSVSVNPGFETDSLTLKNIISTIINYHPSVKQAQEAMNNAQAGISLAKSGYLPVIDAEASYARIGPLQQITFPGFGTFQLYPADNYSASVNCYQSIYDFGKTAKNVALAEENKNLSQQTSEQLKQKLAYSATMLYYSIVYLQQAIVINNKQQKTLQSHLEFVQKKHETGSATQYEILSTQVKISMVESMGIDLQTALKNQTTELCSLMGQTGNPQMVVQQELNVKLPDVPTDSLLAFAYEHRDEIKIAVEKTTVAQLKYKVLKVQDRPSLNLQLSGGGKNGYIPNLNAVKLNYVVGVGLKIPIFNATRTKYSLVQANTGIRMMELETDLAKLTIATEVTENLENLKSALKHIEHYSLQLSQSEQAFALAKTNFSDGGITNLDLLDAATTISESSLLLLKSRIEYITTIYRLKMAIGERLY
ncbi:MAG: TolC family protein [Bacteroidota bacterium]